MWNPAPDTAGECSRRPQATHYLRAELGAPERAAFERHLLSCESCRIELEALRAIIAGLEGSPASSESHELEDGLPERVLARIPAASRPARGYGIGARFGPAAALAAAALVVALAILATRTTSPRSAGDGSSAERSSHVAAAAEESVDLARQWLLANQEADGSWEPSRWGGDPRYRIALTSLAILSLDSAAGGPGRDAALRGLRFVAGAQDESGLIGPRFRGSIYNHSVATMACLQVTRASEASRPDSPIGRALGFLVGAQLADGAWGYLPRSQGGANMAISLWALQALCRARTVGVPGLQDSIRRASGWFHSRLAGDGRQQPRYLGRDGHLCGAPDPAGSLWALVSAAGDPRAALSDRQVRRLVDRLTARSDASASETYFESYVLAHAISRANLPAAESLREQLRESILDSQIRKGENRGSWEPSDRWSPVGGRIYSTTLAAMSLSLADLGSSR